MKMPSKLTARMQFGVRRRIAAVLLARCASPSKAGSCRRTPQFLGPALGGILSLWLVLPLAQLPAVEAQAPPASTQQSARRLVWVDRQGNVSPLAAPARAYALPRISPDEKTIAVEIGPPWDIWLFEIETGVLRRLTADGNSRFPLWSVDGKRVAYGSARGPGNVFWKASDGSGESEQLASGPNPLGPQSWSPDGSILSYYEIHPQTGRDIWMLPMKGADRTPWVYLRTPALEGGVVFSPDGQWLAYSSDQSGRREIYIQALQPGQPALRVSNNGGTEPMWAHSGKELFYREDNKRMSVVVSTQPSLRAESPKMLFAGAQQSSPGTRANYDITAVDVRLLMVVGP
jgi:Tol biopolymer transport system component